MISREGFVLVGRTATQAPTVKPTMSAPAPTIGQKNLCVIKERETVRIAGRALVMKMDFDREESDEPLARVSGLSSRSEDAGLLRDKLAGEVVAGGELERFATADEL